MSIPNTPSLSKLIKSGSEGGHEFARIINQLLFEDSQMYDYYFQSYSDSAGDYKGVDALMEKGLKKIGLQYKFFEGNPKSNKSDLKKSLFNAIDNFPNMDEWILVTPDNFTKHGMQWLDETASLTNITIKHWGHSEIITFMLKYPQIGKKYYHPQVFQNYISSLDREPTKSELNDFFNQFTNPEIDRRVIFLNAQPNITDIKKIFSEDIYKEVSDNMYLLYRDVFESDKSLESDYRDISNLKILSTSVQELNERRSNLPGGMAMVQDEYECFNPNITFYTIKVGGISYSVWCFVNGKWVFIPKPWRMIYSIYGLRESKKINRIIRWLKILGVKTNELKTVDIVVNYIIHGLNSKKN
ncbi:hypothetical protein [Tenacibaculum sp.]|uniref:hypothetical protein n=1 Tax=Tenacibaculum sp. TaxID=1906242 RepID=UPI003D0ED0D9